jgi:Xaa-Pro dipeptidase
MTMQRAIDISETALAATIARIRVGMSEAEIKSRLVQNMLEEGADGAAFDAIVLSGGASADPHGTASAERKISAGDPLLFDFGAAWGGYNADITRTFFVGEPTDEHRAVYEAVLAANTLGREITKPGMTLHDLDDAVTDRLRQSGFGDMIVHKTGHGLGLDVHEAPQVMVGNHQVMEQGMVITIEPGLYRAGDIGVRIEDDVLVADEGCRSLTTLGRDLTVIGG